MTTIIDRLNGVSEGAAVKLPCRVATQINLTLSGLQTIDSVTLVEGDRILVAGQTEAVENGVYVVSTGLWKRADDFNGKRDVVQGTQIFITQGSLLLGSRFFITTANPITIGTTALAFEVVGRDTSLASDVLTYTATAGQTIFPIAGGFDAARIAVYHNGVRLLNGTDVIVSSGTNVVLANAAALSDTLIIDRQAIVDPIDGIPAASIVGFTEAAQDAVGVTFDSTLVYNDASATMGRAALTGEATAAAGSNTLTLTNSAVIGKVLTGYVPGAGTVSNADTILQAIQKLNGNDALKAPLASPSFTGSVNMATSSFLTINSYQVVYQSANTYTVLKAYNGTAQISIGNASDAGTYYDNNLHAFRTVAGVTRVTIDASNVNFSDGQNMTAGTTTGTKIGTSTSQKLGFWNATPVVKPTVTGSKATGAALASLLTQLAAAGLITDSTTV